MEGAHSNSGLRRALIGFTNRLTQTEIDDFRLSTLEDVYEAIHQIQEKQKADKKLRNLTKMKGFLEGMQEYGKIIEVFLNTSGILAFVWGPVKFLLQVRIRLARNCSTDSNEILVQTTSIWIESLDTLLDTYEEIGENIPHFLQYQAVFVKNVHMREVLEMVYTDILAFHERAFKIFKKKTWKIVFHATWKTFRTEFEYILKNLKRHKRLVESQASLVEYEQNQEARLVAQSSFEKIVEIEKAKRRIAVEGKLQPASSAADHENALDIRREYPNTGQWILQRAQMKKWMKPEHENGSLLWLNGIPGAGKTILASLIIEEIRELEPVTLAYFYCKHNDVHRSSFVAILKSLLMQLIQQSDDLLAHVYEKSASSNESILDSPNQLKDLVELSMRSCEHVYIVIDGLDECEEAEEKKTALWFRGLTTSGAKIAYSAPHMLIVSQRDGILSSIFAKASMLSLDCQDHQKDIEIFVDHWCKEIQQKFEIPDSMATAIFRTVTSQAEGLFLYAKLVLSNLFDQTSKAELKREISPSVFPTGLEAAYGRIAKRVLDNANKSERNGARKILAWLICAKRPLKNHELQALFCIDTKSQTIDFEERRLRVTNKDLCGALVETRMDRTVELVHKSAKDYLVNTGHLDIREHSFCVADMCLRYLVFPCFEAGLTESEIHQFLVQGYYAFEDYAIAHWLDHIALCTRTLHQGNDQSLQLLRQSIQLFLSKRSLPSSAQDSDLVFKDNSFEALNDRKTSNQLQNLANLRVEKQSTESYLDLEPELQRRRAAFESFTLQLAQDDSLTRQVVLFHGPNWFKCSKTWCDWFHEGFPYKMKREQHINQHERPFHCTYTGCPVTDVGYGSARDLRRHLAVFHPTDKDCDWTFPTRKGTKESDFFTAAAKGEIGILEKMLQDGFDINQTSRPKGGTTALILAARNNQVDAVTLLIQKGADVNFNRRGYGSALSHAIKARYTMVVHELLSSGASMVMDNQKNLWSLASDGDEIMMRIFIEYGLDLNAESPNGLRMLQLAAKNNQYSLVSLLIEKGADIEAKNQDGTNPLLAAAGYPLQNETLRVLVDAGADVHAQDKTGWTALHWAAACGNAQSIELLQARGALINARSDDGKTPLCLAVKKVKEEGFSGNDSHQKTQIVELLLKLGADIDARCMSGTTILHHAVISGEEMVVKLLLVHGARANERDQFGRTALFFAVLGQSEAITKIMLETGAEKDMRDESGATALHVAISNRKHKSARALLEAGADVAIKQEDGNTPLHAASLVGHPHIIDPLLRYGADIYAVNNTCQTALHLAARKGWKRTTEMLLNHMDVVDMQDIDGNTPLDTASDPAEDYQQLMLLRQQNKKRLLMARQGQGQGQGQDQDQDQDQYDLFDRLAVQQLLLDRGLDADMNADHQTA